MLQAAGRLVQGGACKPAGWRSAGQLALDEILSKHGEATGHWHGWCCRRGFAANRRLPPAAAPALARRAVAPTVLTPPREDSNLSYVNGGTQPPLLNQTLGTLCCCGFGGLLAALAGMQHCSLFHCR